MLTGARIRQLIPHKGSMCLLDEVSRWADTGIICCTRSHLSPDNPLRRRGALHGVCGVEYGLQAAALHGALLAGGAQPPGYLAALRSVDVVATRLDDPSLGALTVTAQLELRDAGGLIYSFALHSSDGAPLLAGRATIVLAAILTGAA